MTSSLPEELRRGEGEKVCPVCSLGDTLCFTFTVISFFLFPLFTPLNVSSFSTSGCEGELGQELDFVSEEEIGAEEEELKEGEKEDVSSNVKFFFGGGLLLESFGVPPTVFLFVFGV